ncbi:MAG: SPOR domain-containing protein [Planctomycetota bacterium]
MNGQSHHPRPEARPRWPRALAWPAVPLVMAGCAASPSSTSAKADLSRALEDYHAGRYAMALQQAAAVQEGTAGDGSGDAAYLGGLAAYRLGDLTEARSRLVVATASASPTTAGKARATLGLVMAEQDRPQEAAAEFAAAARALAGNDAQQAALHAAKAYRRAGDEAAAETWLRIAQGRGRRPGAASAGAAGRFTLQAGAYRQRPRAEQAAVEAAAIAEGHGFSPVRIVPRRDERGDVLYVVQVGRFESRTAAVSARQRLGRLQYIVAAVPPG